MAQFILRDLSHGPFVPGEIRKSKVQITTYDAGFVAKAIPTYEVIFYYDAMARPLSKAMVENPEIARDSPSVPTVKVLVGVNYNGNKKSDGKLVVGHEKGNDIMAFREFQKIAALTNLDVRTLGGRAVAVKGSELSAIWLKVAALAGSGSYPPRNALRDWDPTSERFDAEAAQEETALADALASAGNGAMPDDPGLDASADASAEIAGQNKPPVATLAE